MKNYDHIETFLQEYLNESQQKFEQCTTQLMAQALSCPKSMELSKIESPLKEFVRLHHIDLTRKINFQVNQFKGHIHEKELFQQLSSYSITNEQVINFFVIFLDVVIMNEYVFVLATIYSTSILSSPTTIGKI